MPRMLASRLGGVAHTQSKRYAGLRLARIYLQLCPHLLRQESGNVKTQAGTSARSLGRMERLSDALQVLRPDAASVVPHGDHDTAFRLLRTHLNELRLDAAGGLNRILQ